MNPMILTSERSPLEQTQRVLRKRPELWILPRLRQRLRAVLRRVDRSYYLLQSLASQPSSHARVVGDALQILATRPRLEFVFGVFLERSPRLFPRLARARRDRGRVRRAHRFARRRCRARASFVVSLLASSSFELAFVPRTHSVVARASRAHLCAICSTRPSSRASDTSGTCTTRSRRRTRRRARRMACASVRMRCARRVEGHIRDAPDI